MADPFSIALMVGGIATSALGTFAQMSMSKSAAKAEYAAAQESLRLQYEEADRQSLDLQNKTQEDIADRVRVANREMALARVVHGEQGLSGSTMNRALAAISYAEGTDVSRIKYGYNQGQDALHAQKRAGAVDFTNRTVTAKNRARSEIISSGIGFASTAFSIGGKAYSNAKVERDATNTT